MSDIALSMIAMKQAQTQHAAMVKMIKMQAEMERSVVDLLAPAAEAAKAANAPGTGTKLDKTA